MAIMIVLPLPVQGPTSFLFAPPSVEALLHLQLSAAVPCCLFLEQAISHAVDHLNISRILRARMRHCQAASLTDQEGGCPVLLVLVSRFQTSIHSFAAWKLVTDFDRSLPMTSCSTACGSLDLAQSSQLDNLGCSNCLQTISMCVNFFVLCIAISNPGRILYLHPV